MRCYALLEPLADADFEQVTQFKGYTIGDVIGHLHHWNQAADLSLRDAAGFQAFYKHGRGGPRPRARAGRRSRTNGCGDLRGRALLAEWRRFYREMGERFAAADPKARVPWAGPSMSVRSSITARLMETWAHGQEVYDVLGVERARRRPHPEHRRARRQHLRLDVREPEARAAEGGSLRAAHGALRRRLGVERAERQRTGSRGAPPSSARW